VKAENPEKFINDSRLPVLIDFYADWCAPCELVPAELEIAQKKLSGKFNLLYVNVETFELFATQYLIKSVPTLVLVKGKKELWRMNGFEKGEKMAELIRPYL
jgi:thioredoxin 1